MNTASRLYEARWPLGNQPKPPDFAACFTASVRGTVEPPLAGEVGQQLFVQLDTSCDCGSGEIKRQRKQLPTGLRLQREDGEDRAGLRAPSRKFLTCVFGCYYTQLKLLNHPSVYLFTKWGGGNNCNFF